jgi:hypothetical protein
VKVWDGTTVYGIVTDAMPPTAVIVPYSVHTIILTPTADPGYKYEKSVIDGVDNGASPAAVPIAGNMNVETYFLDEGIFGGVYNVVTVTIDGNGSVAVGNGAITYGTITALTSGGTVNVPAAQAAVTLTATPGTGMQFTKWNGDANGTNLVFTLTMGADRSVNAVFDPVPLPPKDKEYYITATSDPKTTISPKGTVVVPKGDSRTFFFYAEAGYSISMVTVDGSPLSPEEIGKGQYTFRDVNSNHTIHVFGRDSRTDITLRIDIVQGDGYAQYKVNDGLFITYNGVVIIPQHADIVVVAYAGDGCQFQKWETPAVETTAEISFENVTASLHLLLYFKENNGSADPGIPWWILVVIALLILAGFLFWFLVYYRRTYEVIKVA